MAAAELKLQVGLDLAFFRQQLALLGTTATGYSLPINIDRLGIQQEITKLGKNISNRSYTLKVKTTAAIAEAEVDKLKTALDDLQGKEVGIKITGTLGKIAPKDATKIRNDLAEAVAGGTGKKILVDVSVRENAIGEELRAVRKALNEKITPKNGKILVATSIRSGITNEEAKEFRESVKRKVGNIIVNVTGSADQLRAKEAKSIRTSLYQSIISNGGKIKIPATLTIADSEVAAFQKTVNSKFAGITVKVKAEIEEIRGGKAQAQIEKEALAGWQRIQEMGAARMSGGASDPARRESLRQSLSGRDIGELRNIGEQLGVKGARRYSNVQNLIEKIVADASIEMVKKYLDPQAVMRNPDRSGLGKVLDTFARGIFHMLGMDPAAMMAAQKQKLLPPSISWPASAATPPSYQGKAGTMLTGAPVPKGLGGTAFGAQKYLPTALGNETKQVLRDAANAFLDAIRQGIREVKIQDFGNQQRAIAGQRVAGLLSPGIGRTPSAYAMGGETQAELFARRTREAQVKSDLREMDVMGGGAGRTAASYSYAYRAARPTGAIVPYGPGGALVAGGSAPPAPPSPPAPPTPPGGGRGGFGSFGSFRGAMPNVSLPGAGLVREVGDQFGYAAQQVLLFGTTYKALAFLTDFPSKVGEAVAQLQSFRNTLQAITPNADEFQKSNQFILDTVDKYNTPLQSARDGFTNLYASMAPAGFKGDEIRNIFAGISQGAATFGMSADKVDRVNYAFAQMASKGQVMSEELKGQLGDVLPGAVAIFAQAAGFTGPNAMVEFTKAMEEGRYKGEAMKQLLINVGIVMKDKFAKGAEGAAQNFQGQMNAMGNATKKLYEAFEPAGNLFASKVIAPFTNGLQVLTDGFNAFFTGAATKTAGGFALSQELEKLRPTFQGLSENVKQFLPLLQSFATTALGLSKILLQIASNPFVGYMARVYAIVLPLNIALSVMRGLWASNAIQLLVFNARVASGTSMLTAFRSMMATTGATSAATAAVIRGAFATTGIGAILVGLGLLIEHFVKMNQALDESRTKALGASDAIRGMSQSELQLKQNELGRQEVLVRGLQGKNKGEKYKLLTAEEEKMVRELSPDSITNVFRPRSSSGKAGKLTPSVIGGQPGIDISILESLKQKIQSQQQIVDSTRATLKAQDRSANLVLAPIPGAGGVDKAAASALASRQALADKLSADQTKTDIERQKTLFENEKSMINMAYDLREARANSFQKETIRFQRELFNIEMERQKAVLDANSAVTKAQGAVAGGTGMAGLTQYITGDPSQKGYQADHGTIKNYHDHLAFATRKAAEDAYKKLVAEGIKVTEFKGYGQGVTGPHSGPGSLHHQGLAMDVPGYQWKGAGAIGAKEYAGSARVRQVLGIEGQVSAGGKVTARQKRVAVAGQQTENALQDKKVKITLAEAEALKKAEIAMVNYVSSIAPVAEQDLQNQLLGKRIELMQGGTPEAFAETQMKIFEAQEKVRIAGEQLDLTNQKQVEAYEKLKQSLPGYIALLEDAAVKQQQLSFTKAMKDLGDRAAMARAFTPQAELQTRLQQQGYSGTQLGALFETEQAIIKAEELKTQMQGVASTIGTAFGDAFKGIITGSMTAQEALAGFFQNLSNYFADAVSKMIAEWLKVEAIKGLTSLLGGLGGMFGGGGGGPLSDLNAPQTINNPLGYANGGLVPGGFRAFATGGIVTGPTLGLVGEGRYNEAVIPLPDGKSVPVDLGGEGARLGGNGGVSVGAINITVQNTGDTLSPAAQKQIAGQVQGIVLATMADQRRSGGLLR